MVEKRCCKVVEKPIEDSVRIVLASELVTSGIGSYELHGLLLVVCSQRFVPCELDSVDVFTDS